VVAVAPTHVQLVASDNHPTHPTRQPANLPTCHSPLYSMAASMGATEEKGGKQHRPYTLNPTTLALTQAALIPVSLAVSIVRPMAFVPASSPSDPPPPLAPCPQVASSIRLSQHSIAQHKQHTHPCTPWQPVWSARSP
jgi:hypothetical protein